MAYTYAKVPPPTVTTTSTKASTSIPITPLLLNNLDEKISLENYVQIFRDPSKKLTLQDILSPEIQSQFKPYNFKSGKDRYLKPGVTAWVKAVISNPNDFAVSVILRCWLDYTNVYLYVTNHHGQYEKSPSEGFLYWVREVTFNPHETKTLYLQGTIDRQYIYPITLFPFKTYDQAWTEEFFVLGGFLGIATGLIFYNLFLFISTRDKNYFLYIMTWFSFVMYKLLEANVITRYLIPSLTPYWKWVIRDIFVTFSVCMFVAYINSVVKSYTFNPRLQKACNIWYAAAWITYVMYIYVGGVEPQHMIYLFTLTFGLVLASITVTISVLDGFRPARYLFVGVISLLSAAIAHVTLELVYVRNPLIRFIFPLATSLEMILQSLALADRYNLIKDNEENIKKELIISQKLSLQQQSMTINAYERFLPKQVLPLLHRENFLQVNLADSVEINLAVLFSDIRGFTQIAEHMSPQESFEFINRYLAHMAPIIGSENGIIDKYIGDAIMALFPGNPDSAIRAAVKLILETSNVKDDLQQTVHAGVGIHYGQLILGVIGSEERMECTVISDAVNIASRLENMNKIYGTSLLISDIALAKCQSASVYHKRILDKVRFYGKTIPNVVYEIFGYEDFLINKHLTDIVDLFEQGIFYYQHKNFIHAMERFKKCLRIYPEDKPSQLYMQRCTNFLAHGVPANWDSAYQMDK